MAIDYQAFFSGRDIPTVRRLDYIVEDTDGMESGLLYAQLRKMSWLGIYDNPLISEERKQAEWEFSIRHTQKQLTWVNDWMAEHGKEPLFTDINDWLAVGRDYDYFWELRSEMQFDQEEADARAGISGRTPVIKE